ncbi:MAG: rhodanese-like domain-containing protein [Wenzhouxiangellaceae bacterium]|nr:rhodanese-like domain-containing protein [Wenzhouxiangellaceae bacterium]
MEQVLTFIGNHPILVGAFAVVLAALIATESARLFRRWNELNTNQAIMLINRRDPLILDVSNSADFAKGHILNAVNMPPTQIEAGNQKLLNSIERPVLVYCKSGQISPQMATRLTRMGFNDVNVLRGGLAQWVADQQPVSRGKSAAKAGRKDSAGKSKRGRSGKGEKAGKSGKQAAAGRKNQDGSKRESEAVEQSTNQEGSGRENSRPELTSQEPSSQATSRQETSTGAPSSSKQPADDQGPRSTE